MPHFLLIAALLAAPIGSHSPVEPHPPPGNICAEIFSSSAPQGLVAAPRLLFSERGVRARVAAIGDAFLAAAGGRPLALGAAQDLVARVSRCLNVTLFDEVRWWFETHAGAFSPQARDELDSFLHRQTPATLRPDPVMGVDPKTLKGEPPLLSRWGADAAYCKRRGTLFAEAASFDSSQQGDLGDCYFLSAVSSLLARRPHFFDQWLHQRPDGTVIGTFFARAEGQLVPAPVQVTVDELLPERHGKLVACSDRDPRELWPSLLEKLWAAFKGGYPFAGGGIPPDAFTALTGSTTSVLPIFRDSAPEKIYRFIREHEQRGDAMTAETYGVDAHGESSPAFAYGPNHLFRNHAYSLLGTREADGQQMILLRNPWGHLERTARTVPRDDGSLEVTLREFVAAFAEVDTVELPALAAGPLHASADRVTP